MLKIGTAVITNFVSIKAILLINSKIQNKSPFLVAVSARMCRISTEFSSAWNLKLLFRPVFIRKETVRANG